MSRGDLAIVVALAPFLIAAAAAILAVLVLIVVAAVWCSVQLVGQL